MHVTATRLYDYIQCPHRVWRDIYGPQEEKIKETNPFVQLLWDRGVLHEKEVISKIGEYLDLSEGTPEDRYEKTIKAIKSRIPLIYQGVLINNNLVGVPDLLRITSDTSYIPIDIKSGIGREGVDEDSGKEGKLKKHYAIQLALYSDVLNQLGITNRKDGIIIDIKGNEIIYDFDETISSRSKLTFWELYEDIREKVSLLMQNEIQNKPALGGVCKLCPWFNSCQKWVDDNDDLTGLFYLGRSKRDVLCEDTEVSGIKGILDLDIEKLMQIKKKDRTFLKGVGQKTIEKIVKRAYVFRNIKKPIAYDIINLPETSYELFFDIEDDPTQGFVYLHGIYERSPQGEKYLNFIATEVTPDAEKQAWIEFWKYIDSLPYNDYAIYYYSSHEKSTYRRMQKLYPDVISEEKLEKYFDNPNVIDLYNIVLKNTDWPVGSYSLKSLATYLGFKWRDKTPSGALSIQWFNEYIKTGDDRILERILLYNEDDCKATMILKDELLTLPK